MNKRYIFFGGKGGVGKTTCAAGYGLSLSRQGFNTLLISTDPAHSLGDIFNQNITARETPLGKNLTALEIDPQEESKKYMERVKSNLSATISPVILEELHRQIDAAYVSPGAEEAAIFDKLIDIMENTGERYDRVIFDTAPTGHTLRLLSLPELLEAWMESLIHKREQARKLMQMGQSKKDPAKDPVLAVLTKRKEKFQKARNLLIDVQKVSFIFVLTPEKLPILETQKAVDALDKNKIPVGGIIINRILPENETSRFWENRRKIQQGYLNEIRQKFAGRIIARIPLLDSDIRDTTLAQVGTVLACPEIIG